MHLETFTSPTPGTEGSGADRTPIRFALGTCSLGRILVAATEAGVCAILFGNDHDELVRDLHDRFPDAPLSRDGALDRFMPEVVRFLETPQLGLDLPLDLRGTEFQKKVWRASGEIPVGSTASYAEIAARIGAPQAVRAVAQACAANHIAVAIPCHRVLGSDRALSGYRWGVARKRILLDRETSA